jgi:nitrogen fixation NifU-like protein
MKMPYSETVLEHFRHPRNVGKIENPDGKSMEGSPACGDMVAVYIKVDDKTKTISDVKFESYGCASNIATGSIVTEMAKGKTLEEVKKITWEDASKALGGLPKIKAHCSVLAIEGLRSAIQNVRKRLRKVMNPITGLDVVRTNLVKDIALKDGEVRVVIDLPANHQFAPAIKEEITEKIEPLWDVKKLTVDFTE